MNLIVIPFHDWKKCEQEGFRTRDAHLTLELAKRSEINHILVIDRPVSLPEMLLKRRKWGVTSGTIQYRRKYTQLTQVAPKISVLDILLYKDIVKPIRLRKRWWADVFKRPAIHHEIQQAIQYLQLTDYGMFVYTPMAFGLINRLDENYRLFFAVDNWLFHPQMQGVRTEVNVGYQEFSKHSDAIITTSESLKVFFQSKNENVHFITNGVEPSHFKTHQSVRPKDMEHIVGPVVGYAGKIQERIDVNLLQHLVKHLPDVNFVFVGQMMSPSHFAPLRQYSNVHYLGDKSYQQLPGYLASFDVCIIPHVISDFTESMSPLKLFEYLASCKPVVATSMGGLPIDANWVISTSDSTQFLAGIKHFLQNPPTTQFIVPVDWTWEAKAGEVLSIVQSIIANKQSL